MPVSPLVTGLPCALECRGFRVLLLAVVIAYCRRARTLRVGYAGTEGGGLLGLTPFI